jgi:hypothetical protein
MSNYLWDKQGEGDADVARLEALLGAFRHEPRPLEWPPAGEAPEPPRATLLPFASRPRASRLFAPVALAAAAALLVASLLAASAFLRARTAGGAVQAVAREAAPPKEGAPKKEEPVQPHSESAMLTPPPGEGEVKDETPAAVLKHKDERVAVGRLPRVARGRKDAQAKGVQLASGRRQRDPDAEGLKGTPGLTLEAMSTRAGASSLVESARVLTKEQLIYALRLTGAKLNDVRQRAQGSKSEAR